jgi:hypothetical protein
MECRLLVRDALVDDLDRHLVNKAVSHGLDEIGEIATHGWLDDFSVDDVLVKTINSSNVTLLVEGSVDVGLQYGSNSDVRNDIGFVTSDSFPFSATITVQMRRPLGKYAIVESLNVNTDSFYE